MRSILFVFVVAFLLAACDEPPPQWRDDQAVVDEDQNQLSDRSDQSDADDILPDDPVTVDCTVAEPTVNELSALRELFPEDDMVFCADKTAGGVDYFIAVEGKETKGYAFPGAHYGFNGEVSTLTGITPAAKSLAVAVVSQRESWWYMMGQWFFEQFKDIDLTKIMLDPKYSDSCWPCTEMYDAFAPYTVDAVSGATYTSNAVTKGVWDAFYLYEETFTPPAVMSRP